MKERTESDFSEGKKNLDCFVRRALFPQKTVIFPPSDGMNVGLLGCSRGAH